MTSGQIRTRLKWIRFAVVVRRPILTRLEMLPRQVAGIAAKRLAPSKSPHTDEVTDSPVVGITSARTIGGRCMQRSLRLSCGMSVTVARVLRRERLRLSQLQGPL